MNEKLDNSTASEEATATNETTENLESKETAQVEEQNTEQTEGLLVGQEEKAQESKSFLDDLPEELRDDRTLHNFKSVDDLAKSYVEARKLMGKRLSDMTPEEISKFRADSGVPESPEAYDFGIENQEEYNKELVDWYGNTAHELGISQDQAKQMFQKYTEMENEQARLAEQQAIEMQNQQVQQLKQDWGAEFETRVNLAKKAVEKLGGDELRQVLNETGLGNHPVFAKAFAEVGAMISEDPTITGKTTSKFGMSAEDAKTQIKKFEQENKDAIFNRGHKDHKWAIEKRNELYKLAGSIK